MGWLNLWGIGFWWFLLIGSLHIFWYVHGITSLVGFFQDNYGNDYLVKKCYGLMLVDGFIEIYVCELFVDGLFQNGFCWSTVWGLFECYFCEIMGCGLFQFCFFCEIMGSGLFHFVCALGAGWQVLSIMGPWACPILTSTYQIKMNETKFPRLRDHSTHCAMRACPILTVDA